MARILIVDDEIYVRRLLNKVFTKEGYECVTASAANEGRRQLLSQSFDLITLDINMPGESGLDFLRYITRTYPDTAVLMVSIISDPEMAKEALEAGAYGYIAKPFEQEELIINAHNALRRAAVEKENRNHREKLEELVRLRTQELSESEKRYRLLVEKMTEALASVDVDRRLVFVNQRFCEMLKRKKEDLIGRRMDDFIDPRHQQRLEREISKRPSGNEDRYELTWLTSDGEKVFTMVSPTALFNDSGEHIGGQGVITDITRLKLAGQALQRELEINTAYAATAGKLVSTDSIEEISSLILDQCLKMTDSVFGFVGFVDPETGHLVSPTMTREVWKRCRVSEKSEVFTDFKGLWGWALNNKRPILTNDPLSDERSTGTPPGHLPIERFLGVPAVIGEKLVGLVGLANSSHDYTATDVEIIQPFADLYAVVVERNRHVDEIKKSRARLQQILDSIAVGIMIVDEADHVILDVNPSAQQMIGLAREDLVGRECWQFVCPAEKERCPVTNLGQPVTNAERYLLTASGRQVPILKSVAPVEIDNRPALLETFIDISEQKKMEFHLAQAQKLEAVGQLAAGIAHEINTPTQFIHSNVEFLEEIFTQIMAAFAGFRRIIDQTDGRPALKNSSTAWAPK